MKKIHTFEKADLGKAPFKLVDVYEHHEHMIGDTLGVTDYGTNCDFCSTYIRLVFVIESADGKKFKVGSTCVEKTGDKGLVRDVKEKIDQRKREALWKKRDEAQREMWEQEKLRTLEAIESMKRAIEDNKDKLQSRPHPNAYFASKGKTLYDYMMYFIPGYGTEEFNSYHPSVQCEYLYKAKVIVTLREVGATI